MPKKTTTHLLVTRDDVAAMIAEHVKRMGTQSDLATSWGISATYLSDVINGKRQPGEKILDRLGLVEAVFYTKRGAR